MPLTKEDYMAAAAAVKTRIGGFLPEIAVILGSGLGGLASKAEIFAEISYDDIPGFCRSTAPGHSGKLVFGRMGGKTLVFMQGRLHSYEGYTAEQTAFPVTVLSMCGVSRLIITNAAGGVREDLHPGDLMLITDHIKLNAESPRRGPYEPLFGKRFFPMNKAYDGGMKDIARTAAADCNIRLKEGVYFFMAGPQYETPAEVRAIRLLGGDAVGMSTVYEVIAAASLCLPVLGISLITNAAAGVADAQPSGDEVIAEAEKSGEAFKNFICRCIALL